MEKKKRVLKKGTKSYEQYLKRRRKKRILRRIVVAVITLITFFLLYLILILISVLGNIFTFFSEEKVELKDYNIYSENINLMFDDIVDNKLILKSKNEVCEFTSGKLLDSGMNLRFCNEGEYDVYSNDKRVAVNNEFEEIEFTTITREKKNFKITLSEKWGRLKITKKIEPLSEKTYDIVIDPGHDVTDPGATAIDGKTLESELNYALALLVKDELVKLGYKVNLSRNVNEDFYDETSEQQTVENRVNKIREMNPKIVVSVHHNVGENNGFEIFCSHLIECNLEKNVVRNLKEINNVSSKEVDLIADGLYQKVYNENDVLKDYMFIIRELGLTDTKVAIQSMLIEYEYIDSQGSLDFATNKQNMEKEAFYTAKAIDEYIKSKK